MSGKQISYGVLIADDSNDDRFFLRKALGGVSCFKLLAELDNGQAVIAYLEGKEPWHDRAKYPLPDLLLLDLKMPYMDGFGVLEWLRAQTVDVMPVVILSGSFLERDRDRCWRLGARAYYSKSSCIPTMQAMLREIELLLDEKGSAPPTTKAASKAKKSRLQK